MSPSPQTKEAEIVMDKSMAYSQSTVSAQDVDKVYIFMKRAIDFLGSFIGLVILSPLFAVIALLIKIETPKGSIFAR